MFGRSLTRLGEIRKLQQFKFVARNNNAIVIQPKQQQITFNLSNQLQVRQSSTSKLDSTNNKKTFAKSLLENIPGFQKPKSSQSISTETSTTQSARKSHHNNNKIFVESEHHKDNESNNSTIEKSDKSEKSDKQDLVSFFSFYFFFSIFALNFNHVCSNLFFGQL